MSRMGKGLGIGGATMARSRVDRPRRGGVSTYPDHATGIGRDTPDGRARPTSAVRSGPASGPIRACWRDVAGLGAGPDAVTGTGPVVLTRRGRVVVSLVVLVVALAGFGMMSRGADAVVSTRYDRAAETVRNAEVVGGPAAARRVETVVVRPGDTVWSIAERIAPDADPRAVVDRIRELNDDVELGALRVGDELAVPRSPQGEGS